MTKPSFWIMERLHQQLRRNNGSKQPENNRALDVTRESGAVDDKINSGEEGDKATARRGYQRAEDWDRIMKEKKGSMTWEERVQFDGQRYGNQVNQNEILMRNLRSF
eukprot:CAMPEP_0172483580 /NCGR_PEP_ID=MMETSP1066-20121228/10567_1 /TAXON_ID=671091 /ORGANISM="Coscinodiscus wailesii, Strain CCMP2513" /LENGTH=106 /DNA_ID=CAMNT_0013247503 /DNA_START=385 /DNA_END=705 /DNA_ORIENTATION=+